MSNSITIQDPDNYQVDIKELKRYWVVVNKEGGVFSWSISYQRNACIQSFARGLGATEENKFKSVWKNAKKRGHRAVKVNISFDRL